MSREKIESISSTNRFTLPGESIDSKKKHAADRPFYLFTLSLIFLLLDPYLFLYLSPLYPFFSLLTYPLKYFSLNLRFSPHNCSIISSPLLLISLNHAFTLLHSVSYIMFYTIFSSLCKRNLYIRVSRQGAMISKNFKKWEIVLVYIIKKNFVKKKKL